jgi:hypothetical protein
MEVFGASPKSSILLASFATRNKVYFVGGVGSNRGEWQLVTLPYNFKRLWNLKLAMA